MSSSVVSEASSSLFPDIHSPHKHRKTPRSRSSTLWKKENPIKPDEEKTQSPSEEQISQYRKPLHHRVCVSMLREGFHASFAELFALVQCWDKADENPLKLQTIQLHLTKAESAQREGQDAEAYEHHMTLARYFSEPQERWLQHRFFELALLSARRFKMDSGKREAEANLHMGQACLERGDLEQAREHLEVFHQLSVGHSWQDVSGCVYHSRSCVELQKLYALMAQRALQEHQREQAMEMFTQALHIAKESGDRGLEGEAAYRLGLVYQSTGDQKAAIKFFRMCMEIFSNLGDTDSLGRTYKAFGKSLECKQERNLEEAYMCLGNILKSKKQYASSFAHFKRAYEIACEQRCLQRLQRAQVYVGSMHALSLIQSYQTLILTPGRESILQSIRWKERREDSLSPAAPSSLSQPTLG
ncbi:hypothetical protein DNTS_001114 [Danionella cerebrum]|uniref:Tetratricopeptide repeat protein 29 n=1 Tax=Danionella cerebrum TaxID=2873325 RepID=A0A553QUK2_9TELE|nr:hypothetical protein DNTS_001114 [Danionella translucida]